MGKTHCKGDYMRALQVEDVKGFMNKLFKDVTFDEFEVVSVDISQGITYAIDGTRNPNFYNDYDDEQDSFSEQKYIRWADLKSTIFSIIKGNKTPSIMKIVLTVSNKNKLNLVIKSNSEYQPGDINGFYLNIIFDANGLKVISGTNYKLFTLDKSAENYFDDSIIKFFAKHEILAIPLSS